MQPSGPPRPFQGSQYDKNMFTFLPAGLNRDVLPESSRKRKLTPSDYQMNVPSNVRREISDHQSDSQCKRTLNSTPPFRSSESSSFRGYPDQSQYRHQNTERPDFNERSFYESRSNYTPFSMELESSNHKVSSSSYPISEGGTKTKLSFPPPVMENFNEYGNHVAVQKPSGWQPPVIQRCNPLVNRESDVVRVVPTSSNFQPSVTEDSFRHGKRDLDTLVMTHNTSNEPPPVVQEPVQSRAISSDLCERASNILAELQQVNGLNPRALSVVLDEKSQHKEVTHKVDCPSDVSRVGIDSDKRSRNNTSTSVYNLQTETNNLLNVLKLLSAASGIGTPENNEIKIQDSGRDVKIQAESTLSKKHDNGQTLGRPCENVECKLDDGGSSLGEKLWGGTLKLSTSVSLSAIAFFKSGEKIQDISWSDIVEVKGKVRLEAFEKYVQDLPRSRSRGLLVTSLCCKEGSSNAEHKGMKEVAKKYKNQKKVGFAKLSTDIDIYICPHNDAIITIVTKNGFCKGMTYIEDQNVPLIGCVVWKKNSSSSHSKHAEVSTNEKEQNSTRDIEIIEKETSPEVKTDVELNNPVLNNLSVASKSSMDDDDNDDDDDLPEYDFSTALVSKTSEAEAHKSNSEGPDLRILEQKSEVKMLSLPVQEQKPVEKGVESSKKRNIFDDDDMPEWSPPDIGKNIEEGTIRVESSNSLSHSSTSGFANLTSGVLLPPPPPPPPLTQFQLQGKSQPLRTHPLTQFQLQGKSQPSAPPVRPPPLSMNQVQIPGNYNNPFVHLLNPPAVGFMPETPASMSTQLPLKGGKYPFAPHAPPRPAPPRPAPLTDKSSSDGRSNENPTFPPGFTPNPGFRPGFGPCFDPPGTKNGLRPSTWRRQP